MIIFITTEYIYVKCDYDIDEINANMDTKVGTSKCILVLHTTNYHFDLPSTNKSTDNMNNLRLENLIKNIIQNDSHLILNYNLEYMIEHFDSFKNSFKVLFNLNPYLFIKNLKYASCEIKEIDYDFFEHLIYDYTKLEDVYKLSYLFLEEFRIDRNNYNELIVEYTYNEHIKFDEYLKTNKISKIDNTYFNCIVDDNKMQLIECEFDLGALIPINSKFDLSVYIELDFDYSNSEFVFNPNHTIYSNIALIDLETIKSIDYNISKFIENYDEDDKDYTIDDILHLQVFDETMFKEKLREYVENNMHILKEKKLSRLIELLD